MVRERVTIESLAHGGDGVARLPDGRTAFVPLACPGDECSVTVVEDHGRWVRAFLTEIHESSHDRVNPPCSYFGTCGGCQWEHVSYERQLQEKRRIVSDALMRIGRLPSPDVAHTIPSPSPYAYRNKIDLAAATSKQGFSLGLRRSRSDEIVPVDRCLLLPQGSQDMPRALGGALRFLSSRCAAEIVRASVRVSTSADIAVDVLTTPGSFPRSLAAQVLSEAAQARTITRSIASANDAIHDIRGVETLAGPGRWQERLNGDRYSVSPPSFFQVNTAGACLLRAKVQETLGTIETMRVADIYAGVGTFTLPLARAARSTVAVEGSRYALEDLRLNISKAGLKADVVPGDAGYVLRDIGQAEAAVIDPPRSGISDRAMRALVEARIPKLVYVSCDPTTLARDIRRLTEAGYSAKCFVPVDMFPQTFHIETVAALEFG